MLNTTDPCHPERLYTLDLRRWDHREMCKILISLAIAEPGDNWVSGGEYRWSKYDEPVPGWILPAPWAQPDSADGKLPRACVCVCVCVCVFCYFFNIFPSSASDLFLVTRCG